MLQLGKENLSNVKNKHQGRWINVMEAARIRKQIQRQCRLDVAISLSELDREERNVRVRRNRAAK